MNITTELEALCDPFILTTEVDYVTKTESENSIVNTKHDDIPSEPKVHNFYDVSIELYSDEHLQDQLAQPSDSDDASNALPDDLPSYEIFQHTTLTP